MNVSRMPSQTDDSGRVYTRVAITEAGWSFLAHFIEVETSVLNSIYDVDINNQNNHNHISKFYDANNAELTIQEDIDASCVKSVFTFRLGIDFEIVSGEIHHYERPLTDVRLHSSIGAFDNNGNIVSSKLFVRNLNLRYKDKAKAIVTDGRSPKLLKNVFDGLPFEANQIQIICYHDVGVKHKIMVELEYYRI